VINSNALKGRIVAAGFTQGSLAKKIGISENSFSLKANNKAQFNVGEVVAICDNLDIKDPEEIVDIFLPKTSQ